MPVCVGEEFEVDDNGRLRIKICGSPAEQAWPYPCAASLRNPLRVDPDCGLWIPPYPEVGTAFASGETSSDLATVPAGFTEVTQAEIDITNPSDCHSAFAIQFVQVDVDFYIPAGADARGGYAIGNNSHMAVENPAGMAGTQMTGVHWEGTQVYNSGAALAPGAATTLVYPIQVGSGQGGAQYGQVRWQVRCLILAGL